jgi:hypothetical protein
MMLGVDLRKCYQNVESLFRPVLIQIKHGGQGRPIYILVPTV